MTRLFNDPDDFVDDAVRGFAAASARWARPVTGGVVRSTRGAEPTVAVVIGALGVKYLTIHAMGGPVMLRAGVEGLHQGAAAAGLEQPIALAVTVLLTWWAFRDTDWSV